ncbi:MAG: ComEC/Rec2 family competence protein [Patescibacteria group bacterium]|jgi:competence protein ComEC
MPFLNWVTEPYFKYLPQEEAALLAGIVWGQKTYLTTGSLDLFRQTGLLHLLVLSGQNITLLLAFFDPLTQWVNFRLKLIIVVMVAGFYCIGFSSEPSIVRASVMAIVSSGVIMFERQTPSMYVFLLSEIVLLIYQPMWLWNISFWLSTAATFGIILLYPSLRSKNYIRNQIGLTFAAQVFTTPIILLNFRQYPLLSILSNLFVTWLIEPIMFFGVILSFAGHIDSFLATVMSYITLGVVRIFILIVQVSYFISSLPILRI